MTVGATIETIIIDDTTERAVSASKFVPDIKTDKIKIQDRGLYSKEDTLVIYTRPIKVFPVFDEAFSEEILKSLSIAQEFIKSKDPNCSLHNISEKTFPPDELTDRFIRVGLSTHYSLMRCTTLGLHFAEPFIEPNLLCDRLDANLRSFYDKEKNGFRKLHFGKFGRNILQRQYTYFGRDLRGFVYISLSSEVLKNDIFTFIKAIKKSIDEYHNG